jgi:ABC-2 type transport system permease protein
VGGPFEAVANCLPFVHAVNAGRAALTGESMLPALLWVSAYAAGLLLLGVLLFRRRMRRGQI